MSDRHNSSQKHEGILLESGTNEVEFLEFMVGTQRYGVNVSKVSQALVWEPESLTVLPGSVGAVAGSVMFRDIPISVIDLSLYLEIDPDERSDQRLLLVTQFNQKYTGFLIDGISRIHRVSWKNFVPMDDMSFQEAQSFVVGTVTVESNIILILDLESIMSDLDPSMRIDTFTSMINADAKIDRKTLKIVYCEDSEIIQKVAMKTLTNAGFENIKLFPSGAKGYEYIESVGPEEVEFILSDIEMPEMDGLALCKKVKDNPAFQNTPFVFFSSMCDEPMKEKCRSVGGDDAFSKPEIHKIVDAIENLCSRR